MYSVTLDKIEDFLEKQFDITIDNRYGFISFGYIIIFLIQFFIYLMDGFCILFGVRNGNKISNIGLPLSIFIFSALYIIFFLIVEPENKRWFGACGILSVSFQNCLQWKQFIFQTVHLICSLVYYFNMYVNLDFDDAKEVFYSKFSKDTVILTRRFSVTNYLAPFSMFCMTGMLIISAYVMCKMSFFRSYTRMLSDLYQTEEQGGKKAV
ncbi:hypothetical protein CAEBREN_12958 [Caenorhabditis brenneri]|uniref:Uncharacterized protein n=1 Tax=Caenorhabditis brenneri TaxID=135651 RepID=G0PNP2_CAEBE|nr:hypothetical protein CAEBREN_12958 [Caenorhabditis brenneri]